MITAVINWFNRNKKCRIIGCENDLGLNPYTVQMNTLDGLLTMKVCSECAKAFDEYTDLREETINEHRNKPV